MDPQIISGKQLPPNHIIERRFKPYEKASQSIKHLENLHKLNQSATYYDKCKDLYIKFKQQPPQNCSTKQSISPISKISKEILEKIDLLGIYNNLSESKTVKKISKRISQPPRTAHEVRRKIEERNRYTNMLNDALIECKKKDSGRKAELVDSTDHVSAKRIFQKKKCMQRESRGLERVESTNASEIVRYSSKRNIKTPEVYLITQFQEKINNLPALTQRKLRKTERKNSLERVLSITPIYDAYNCIELY